MTEDRTVRTSLVLCAMIALLAAAYLARPIIAPVTFALFIVAVVFPLQGALQAPGRYRIVGSRECLLKAAGEVADLRGLALDKV